MKLLALTAGAFAVCGILNAGRPHTWHVANNWGR